MKQIKAILLIAVMALVSCGGGGNDDPIIPETPPDKPETPTTTNQAVTFKASTQLQQNVSLTGLKAAVSDFDNNISWVTSVIPLGYSGSGAPTVTITVSENTGSVSRSGDVTFTDTKGNKVVLTVKQAGRTYGIDDPHDTQSDQPAYSRRK